MSQTKPFFIPQKEFDLINQMNEELIDEIVGQSVDIYKVNIEKTDENILYWMADEYQQSADYETALSILNQITETGKRRIDDALVQKGLLHRKMGREELAIAAFNDVVSLYPESEYIRLAQMELKKSDGMIQ